MDAHISVAGVRATSAIVSVPSGGAWVADIAFDGDTALPSGKVTLMIGPASFVGTVSPRSSGTFQLRRYVRIVAGAGAWRNELPARHLHNDAGLRASYILSGVASAVGEELVFTQNDARIGVDFVRQRGAASITLRELATRWHVDYAGKTQVGPRVVPSLGKFELLNFDPRKGLAELAADDVRAVSIGSVLTDRLDAPLTVQQLEIRVENNGARIWAWGTT